MPFKNLILATTNKIDKEQSLFKNNGKRHSCNLEGKPVVIAQVDDEPFFARPLIPKQDGRRDLDLTSNSLIAFADKVFDLLSEDQMNTVENIFFFVHAEELGKGAFIEEIEDEENSIIRHIQGKFPNKNIRLIAFKHEQVHFFGKILSGNVTKQEGQAWSDLVAEKCILLFDFRREKKYWKDALEVKNKTDLKHTIYFFDGEELKEEAAGTFFGKNSIIYPKIIGGGNKNMEVNIVFITAESLISNVKIDKLIKEIYDDFYRQEYNMKPYIFVGNYDLMNESKRINTDMAVVLEQLKFDPRYRFFDSSIWMRYVPILFDEIIENKKTQEELTEIEKQRTFEYRLNKVLQEVEQNVRDKIYKTNVAREYIEYNLRLFQISLLKDMGGHASAITPFMFHSETLMEKKANDIFNRLRNENLEWDLLLIDDFADDGLNIGDDRNDNSSKTIIKKSEIIHRLINNFSKENGQQIDGKNLGYLYSVTNIEDALLVLNGEEKVKKVNSFDNQDENQPNERNKTYDILLLDYLFSKDREKTIQYGTELLEAIENGEKKGNGFQLKNGKAFDHKYWIFPVSVFSDALHSSMRQKGIQHLERNWVLARGADPINTPHLFREDLYQFLALQFNSVLYTKEEIIQLWLQNEIEEDKDAVINARSWARKFLNILWNKFGKSESVLSFNSRFAKSAKIKVQLLDEKVNSAYEVVGLIDAILHNLAYASIYDLKSTTDLFENLYKILTDPYLELSDKDRNDIEVQLKRLGEGIYAIHNEYQ